MLNPFKGFDKDYDKITQELGVYHLHFISFQNNFFLNFQQNIIKEHRSHDNIDNPSDYMGYFLLEQKRQFANGESSTFNDRQLITTSMDFLVAGQESTATTLSWAILLILKHPEVEKKIFAEIDRVIGLKRTPCLEDQRK